MSYSLCQLIYSLLFLGVACWSFYFVKHNTNKIQQRNPIIKVNQIEMEYINCHVLSAVHTQMTIPNGHLKLNQARNIKKKQNHKLFWFWWRLGISDDNNLAVVLATYCDNNSIFFIFIYSPSMALNAKIQIKVMFDALLLVSSLEYLFVVVTCV